MIAVVAALREEAAAIKRRLAGRRRARACGPLAWRGTLRDRPVLLHVAGDGPRRARLGILRLLAAETPRRVVIVGACGGLVPDLPPGAVFCPDRVEGDGGPWTDPLPSWSRVVRDGHRIPGGTLLSVDRVVTDPAERARLAQRPGSPVAVDLETATWVAALAEAGIPWVVLRGVSDGVAERLPRWLPEAVAPDGSTSRLRVATRTLRDPSALRALLRLGMRVRRIGAALVPLVETLVDAASADRAELTDRTPGANT